MAETVTTEYTSQLSQSGHEDNTSTFVTDQTSLGNSGNTAIPHYIGLTWDFSSFITLDSENRGLDPVGIYPTILTMFNVAFVAGTEWTLAYNPVTNPNDFSDSNLPSDSASNFLDIAHITLSSSLTGGVTSVEFRIGQTGTMALADGSVTYVDTASYKTNHAKMFAELRKPAWQGKIQFVLYGASGGLALPYWYAETVSGSEPILTAKVFQFHTGHNKAKPGDRAVHCQRTGRPVGAGDLSEDNYQEGVWVVSDALDPTDSRRNPPEFSDTEGDRLDEVPD